MSDKVLVERKLLQMLKNRLSTSRDTSGAMAIITRDMLERIDAALSASAPTVTLDEALDALFDLVKGGEWDEQFLRGYDTGRNILTRAGRLGGKG